MAEEFYKDYNLWILLRQAGDSILKAREKELSQHGISARKAAVLLVVDTLDNKATPGELSRWLLREPHSISAILTRMEQEGLVNKTKDLGKKRRVRVTLTEKGQQVLSLSIKRESIRDIMSSLSEEECRQLWSSLRKLRDRALKYSTTVKGPPFP